MTTMDSLPVYIPRVLPKDEPFVAGRRSCRGCGKAVAARMAAKAVLSDPPAHSLLQSPDQAFCSQTYAYSTETGALVEKYFSLVDSVNRATAGKSSSSRKAIQKPVIGISRQILATDYLALAGLAEKRRPALYICFDNESHLDQFILNAGVQPFTVNDAHHPPAQQDFNEMIAEKNLPAALASGNFSYVATACASFSLDYLEKINKGISCEGSAFILVLAPCPTGWIFSPRFGHAIGAYAVQTGYFPLYEIEGGKITINRQLQKRSPVQQFLQMQKRFATLPAPLVPVMQQAIDTFCDALLDKERSGAA